MAQHAAVLGVNFGHVGFLADIRGDELAEALERLAAGEALLDERTALVAADRDGAGSAASSRSTTWWSRAFRASAWPGCGWWSRASRCSCCRATAIVIASPTGSTAYTVGAGGPAVAPSLDAIVITPLASQGTPLRSLVVDGSEVVRVELEPKRAAEHRDRRPRDARHAGDRRSRSAARAQGAARAHATAHLLSRPGHPAVIHR